MRKVKGRSPIDDCEKDQPTSSTGQVEVREDLLVQDFEITTINEKWVAGLLILRI